MTSIRELGNSSSVEFADEKKMQQMNERHSKNSSYLQQQNPKATRYDRPILIHAVTSQIKNEAALCFSSL